MGLRDSEYESIVSILDRTPTLTELGMFAVMWSEHCGYKYSRPILSYFRRYKEAMEGEGHENAGIVPIGDGLGVVMKVESHNHPSAVEPYQGAATGVGGIIRDIFTMGARPIACLNSLRFGPIVDGETDDEHVQRNRFLVDGVVRGIAGYGNCVGVPTVGGEVGFHHSYNGRPLVNAMCVGLIELDKVATAGAAGIGNPVIYLGSATGKDGIHGATFASEELEDGDDSKRPNVQIGDPFAEKQLIEATLEALATGAVQSIQDMGAAGLTCSTVEMSAKGDVGMEIDLDLVPKREQDMSAYELMLSESQERMLCVAHKGREAEVIKVFHKWGVHAVVIGTVTSDGMVTAKRHGKVEACIPAQAAGDGCPTYVTEGVEPEWVKQARDFKIESVPAMDPLQAMEKLAGSPSLASKQWVYRQYDTQVQTQTVLPPGKADAAVLAPRGTKKGLAVKIDGNGLWVRQDPYVGGQLAVAEACRNVACTGAHPVAVTDGLNYGSPEDPEIYWTFDKSVKGIADACETMGTPVVSGNVSFYNHGDEGPVLPTPMIGALGVIDDVNNRLSGAVAEAGLTLWLLRYEHAEVPQSGLGASAYLSVCHGIEDGRPVPPNMESEKLLCGCLAELANKRQIVAAHDVSEGGLAWCLAEMLDEGVGAEVSLPSDPGVERADGLLFGEFPGWIVVATRSSGQLLVPDMCKSKILVHLLGQTSSGNLLRVCHNDAAILQLDLSVWRGWHTSCFGGVLD